MGVGGRYTHLAWLPGIMWRSQSCLHLTLEETEAEKGKRLGRRSGAGLSLWSQGHLPEPQPCMPSVGEGSLAA
jgi:hypothetical protein